jgi:hydroxymethylbilane synthase
MNLLRPVRIGTRESELALFQAREVEKHFIATGANAEVHAIPAEGDIDLETPLYEMGIQGIFTKTLDAALLQNRIDVAVHSAKDIPTRLAKGLTLAAVLERASAYDALVLPARSNHIETTTTCVIATSSLRRRNQWLYNYPNHSIENLRGNIQTRLVKLDSGRWDGAIFAQAALQRLNIATHTVIKLDWMLPAPAQGAIAVVCRTDDMAMREHCLSIHHEGTGICISAERQFLGAMHGGCAVPIAAHGIIQHNKLVFHANIMTLDAREKLELKLEFAPEQFAEAGLLAANEMTRKGADQIIRTFRAA